MFKSQIFSLQVPDCLKQLEKKFDIVEKNKITQLNATLKQLKAKNELLTQRLNIIKRN